MNDEPIGPMIGQLPDGEQFDVNLIIPGDITTFISGYIDDDGEIIIPPNAYEGWRI